jgi:hypothetical protein
MLSDTNDIQGLKKTRDLQQKLADAQLESLKLKQRQLELLEAKLAALEKLDADSTLNESGLILFFL